MQLLSVYSDWPSKRRNRIKPQKTTEISARKIQKLSWIILLILTVAGWVAFSPLIGKSIFVGGLISNFCFKWLEKDLTGLFNGSAKPAKIK
ncbi:MAG: ATP synthase subunit I, partial [Desulfobulbaceae bacterium]|nr:ATP synthase subunit I [Desulfobulbaceae bacterium]